MSALKSRFNASRRPAPVGLGLWWRRLLSVAILFAFGLTVCADDAPPKTNDLTQLSLEALMEIDVPKVSSASKFEQKATEAPAIITVVTADEIKLQGYRTLGELLQSVPGFHVSSDRNYSFLGSQGISLGDFNSRTLLLVNGHRQNNNLTDGAYVDNTFILDMDLVDHVEIIQGPNAVLYGNNAFFGVINVITRKGGQLNGLEASGEYGELETYKGRISYGRSFTNGLEMLLSGSMQGSAGGSQLFFPTFNSPSLNHGLAKGLDGESSWNSFASFSYRGLSLEAAYNHREKDNPTAQYFTAFNTHGLMTDDDRGYANLKFVHEFPQIVDVMAQVYYDYAGHNIGYPFGAPPGGPFFKEDETGQWWGMEVQLSKHLWDKHTLTVGTEYRNDFSQEDLVYEPATQLKFTDNHRSQQSYGIYAEGDFELLKTLRLNSGVRYDQYGDFSPALDPRVALIYNPFEKSTIKAIYGTAFRAPNYLELSDPRFKKISPEDISSYDLVYEQEIGRNLRTSVSGFYNQMNDLIVFNNGKFQNLNVESEGLEFAIVGVWQNGIRGRASYTLQNARNLSTSLKLPDSPENLVKLDLTVPVIKEKLFASLELQYTDRRSTLFTTTTGLTQPGQDLNGYSVVNINLFSQNLVKNLDLSLGIYNLFDQHYSDPATAAHLQSQIPQNGRSFRFKLTYRF